MALAHRRASIQARLAFKFSCLFGLLLAFGLGAAAQERGVWLDNWRKPQRGSVLLVAVEGLGVGLVPCLNLEPESHPSGLRQFCQESVRFTHAFTPSVLSQSALSSLLTGLYPFVHGVRNNGPDFLSGQISTAAHWAKQQGLQTGFISGGPPIWSKSGLNSGFDYFDDRVRVDLAQAYRPAQDSFALLRNWLDTEVKGRPFFAVVYLPDMQFAKTPTRNRWGELRELSVRGQLQAVDEALGELIENLKRRGLWEGLHVILSGLNGQVSERRREEFRTINLHSENTQVALLIKPAGKRRDLAMNWKSDVNVSLVDVGATLREWFGGLVQPASSHQSSEATQQDGLSKVSQLAPVHSLTSLLTGDDNGQVNLFRERILLSESAWPQWRGQRGVRWSARSEHYLVFWTRPPTVYNTLIDSYELVQLGENEMAGRGFLAKASRLMRELGASGWSKVDENLQERISLGVELWSPSPHYSLPPPEFKKLARQTKRNGLLGQWLAELALRDRRWRDLLELAKIHHNEIWRYVAERNLGQASAAPKIDCFYLAIGRAPLKFETLGQKCTDETFTLLLVWLHAADERSRESSGQHFVRRYRYDKVDAQVSELNYLNALAWDTRADTTLPSLSDLALALPENSRFADQLRRRLMARVEENN